MTAPFWSDDFDADLPKLLPEILDNALGATASLPLWTYGGESYGRLNHPAVWGGAAFFGTNPGSIGKPDWYHTGQPLIEATWREVVRDAWVHTYLVVVDGAPIWDTRRLSGMFTRLMYDLRGWTPLDDRTRDRLRGEVLASVIAATSDLRALVGVTS